MLVVINLFEACGANGNEDTLDKLVTILAAFESMLLRLTPIADDAPVLGHLAVLHPGFVVRELAIIVTAPVKLHGHG